MFRVQTMGVCVHYVNSVYVHARLWVCLLHGHTQTSYMQHMLMCMCIIYRASNIHMYSTSIYTPSH